jgi:hypothetical protein
MGNIWPIETPWILEIGVRSGWGSYGDGCLLYPGKIYEKPMSSIRLELMRDGIEDYEYFWILNKYIKQLEKKPKSRKYRVLLRNAKKELKIGSEIIKDLKIYTLAPEVLMEKRKKVARQIEKIKKIRIRKGRDR